MTISIQGYKGSFHHIVAQHFFGDNIKLLERDTFAEVFQDTMTAAAEFGIVAIENTIAGSIGENYDLLLQNNLWIVHELNLRITQQLIALPEVSIRDIRMVYSHPMAIKQCKDFLYKHSQWKIQETSDTAGSVLSLAKQKNKHAAAIASSLAARLYAMRILAKNIETNKQNYTKFFVLSRIQQKEGDKTSLVCKLKHEPGSLMSLLKVFFDKNINLTKIESRPIIGDIWHYYFYIDIESNIYKNALYEDLQRKTEWFKVLGVYTKGIYIHE
jgi:prephenate dehydratase